MAPAFELIWTSQNEVVTVRCGRYASVPEASADREAAEAMLLAAFPSSVDFHYPHDIRAGTWRVVPATDSVDSDLVLMYTYETVTTSGVLPSGRYGTLEGIRERFGDNPDVKLVDAPPVAVEPKDFCPYWKGFARQGFTPNRPRTSPA